MKTFFAKPNEVPRNWILVDLEGQTLGRVATQIATILRGKHKPEFTPHIDTGDFVVAINADKVRLTGHKLDDKYYHRHSGYMGSLKSVSAKDLLKSSPEDVVRFAVRGMLPKTSLGRKLLKKLKVYATAEHPHAAQQPQPLATIAARPA